MMPFKSERGSASGFAAVASINFGNSSQFDGVVTFFLCNAETKEGKSACCSKTNHLGTGLQLVNLNEIVPLKEQGSEWSVWRESANVCLR